MWSACRAATRGMRTELPGSLRYWFITPWAMENRHVDRESLDEALARLVTDAGFQPEGWTHTEVKEYRRLVQGARAAKVDTDLRHMRLLRMSATPTIPPRRGRR